MLTIFTTANSDLTIDHAALLLFLDFLIKLKLLNLFALLQTALKRFYISIINKIQIV
jgi:hypothetical protein